MVEKARRRGGMLVAARRKEGQVVLKEMGTGSKAAWRKRERERERERESISSHFQISTCMRSTKVASPPTYSHS